MSVRIIIGDTRVVLPSLPDKSVHCCVTSPPFYGLRDYGTAQWEGGRAECDHRASTPSARANARAASTLDGSTETVHASMVYRDECGRCGARRVDAQIGLEPTPDEYVASLVAVFRDVRRVLRDDGTLWLNLGDSYAGGKQGRSDALEGRNYGARVKGDNPVKQRPAPNGYKSKDLLGIPWAVAVALRADGWVLRSEIIWAKKNCMPESVSDRPTKSHEQIFLFSKAKWVGATKPVPMAATDAAWLAALVDGEGSICFQERTSERAAVSTWSVRLSIANTNRALLERVTEICGIDGGLGTPSPRYRSTGESGRAVYSWQVTNAKASGVLASIRPYLIAKCAQADLAIFVQELNQKHAGRGHPVSRKDQEAKARAAAACSALNKGEPVDLSWFRQPRPGRWEPFPYAYDADAIAEPAACGEWPDVSGKAIAGVRSVIGGGAPGGQRQNATTRNRRSVWTVASQPYSGAHFATFPPALIEPCILAGAPRQACEVCGAGWVRATAYTKGEEQAHERPKHLQSAKSTLSMSGGSAGWAELGSKRETTVWQPSCECEGATGSARGVVLDPFGGAGTTGLVADRLGRDAVLIELNPSYAGLADNRTTDDAPLFADVRTETHEGAP